MYARNLAFVSVFVVVAVEVAQAQPLEIARRHYERAAYDQALVAIEEAEREAADDRQRAEALLLEGFVEAALERPARALDALRHALRLSPSLDVPGHLSPELTAILDRARRLERERREQHARVGVALLPIAVPAVARRGMDIEVQLEHPFPGLAVQLEVTDEHGALVVTLPMVVGGDGRRRASTAIACPTWSSTVTGS